MPLTDLLEMLPAVQRSFRGSGGRLRLDQLRTKDILHLIGLYVGNGRDRMAGRRCQTT